MSPHHLSRSIDETIALGREAGSHASAGDVYVLVGGLGAGKTHWIKGFVAGAGSSAVVTSPTFGLVHEYHDGRLPIFHFDFYRVATSEEIESLGWDEYLDAGGVILAEWGDRFPELMPSDVVCVEIEANASDATRWVTVRRGHA